MKNTFTSNSVILTPDIVFYLKMDSDKTVRNNILLVLRNDRERNLSDDERLSIHDCVSKYGDIVYTDTHGSSYISHEDRLAEVEAKLDEFKSAKLVITDRIHGMVFAAITATPCVALSNYNYKVKGTYEWIKHIPYICFADNVGQALEYAEKMINIDKDECIYDNAFAVNEYKQIIDIIKNGKAKM